LKKENQERRDKLQQYKALEEDMAGAAGGGEGGQADQDLDRGGGFQMGQGDLVTKKLDAVAAEHSESVIPSEGQRQMAAIVERHEARSSFCQAVDRSDHHRHQPGRRTAVSAAGAPAKAGQMDYGSEMQDVRNQGGEGSVVGLAAVYALEYQIWKKRHEKVRLSPR